MKLLTTKKQSQFLDKKAEALGLSGDMLMDTAGKKASLWILKKFPKTKSFSVFCGPGHNGGDGFVTALALKKAGRRVDVFSLKSSNPLFNKKKKKLESLKVKVQSFKDWKSKKNEILIDALFGVGLSRKITGDFKKLILKMNSCKNPVLALDVPSGLCADTGQILGVAVKSDYTLSFALGKPGFYLNEGVEYSGEIHIFPIGFPKKLLTSICNSLYLAEKKEGAKYLPSYKKTASKITRGSTLIVSGKKGMWGCGLLACRAAYHTGSGYVTWAAEDYPYKKSLDIPEALLSRISDKDLFLKKTAVGAGPGMGFSKEAEKFLLKLKNQKLPKVLDADALTLLSKKKNLSLNKSFLLTPHSGELSRLLKISSKKIEKDRIKSCKEAAGKYKCWVLLKGLYPVLSDGKQIWILPFGNSALGKAGSGDVLTGILSSLLAQGLSPFQAGVLGVLLQGETASRWVKKGKSINSFSASGIIKDLPFVMSELHSLKKKKK